jgi:glycosyltransferase involved in cell wall biosynthesis
MKKLVSVLIPTYGGGDYLQRTVDSVLAQTYSTFEVIVIDDNGLGTENQKKTQAAMDYYKDDNRVIYLCHEVNRNGSAARNTGFAHSKGDYICLLDDDDEYTPEKLERQVEALELYPECGLTYCSREMYVNGKLSSVKRALPSDDYLFDLVTHRRGISSGTLMVRREVWLQLNGFDESFRRHQDYEFTARVAGSFKIIPLDFVGLKKYMVHRNNAKNLYEAFGYRTQYMHTVMSLISSYTAQQRRQVIEANYMSLAAKALSRGDVKTCVAIYQYVKPGLWGYTYLIKYAMKAIRAKRK